MTCFLKSCALAKQTRARNVAVTTGTNLSRGDVMKKDLSARLATDCRGQLESESCSEILLSRFWAGLTDKWNPFRFAEPHYRKRVNSSCCAYRSSSGLLTRSRSSTVQ